jgi:uncharacterized protein (TIGR00369 family)
MSDLPKSSPRSPVAALLGWELIAEHQERGEIEIAFEADAKMTNPHGTVQGGFVAAMLDETMGPALYTASAGKSLASTIDMNISYVRPMKPGRVFAKGRVVNAGRTIAFLEAELFDENGKLLARATSTAIPLPI